MRAAVLASCLLVVVACGGTTPLKATATPAPTHLLNVGEVQQLFVEWMCPAKPFLAQSVFAPTARADWTINGATDEWTIITKNGDFAFRESTRIFVPAAGASTIRRSTPGCQAGNSPSPNYGNNTVDSVDSSA